MLENQHSLFFYIFSEFGERIKNSRLLHNHSKIISRNHTFTITQEGKEFAKR